MKKSIYIVLIMILFSCSSKEELIDEFGTRVTDKLSKIDTVSEMVSDYPISKEKIVSEIVLNNDNCIVISESMLGTFNDYNNSEPFFDFFWYGGIEFIPQAKVALNLDYLNYPNDLENQIRIGLGIAFEDIIATDYLIVVREIEHIEPILIEGKGADFSYQSGFYRGMILVFDIENGSFVNAMEFSSENSDSLSIEYSDDDEAPTTEDYESRIYDDLKENTLISYKSTIKKMFPNQTKY